MGIEVIKLDDNTVEITEPKKRSVTVDAIKDEIDILRDKKQQAVDYYNAQIDIQQNLLSLALASGAKLKKDV